MESRFNKFQIDLMAYPSSRWHKFMFVAPLYLWRLGLGPILGRVLLILSHTGRTSGRIYHTMIEYHKLNGTIYAPSAFGSQADWYKNTIADPRVTIQTANKSQGMVATRVFDEDEILDVFRLFYRRDPPITTLYLKSLDIRVDEEDILRNKEKIHWIRFDPTDESTPAPLETDLSWIWLPIILVMFAFFFLRRLRKNE